ncbi:MAG: hypothetical protein IKW04_03280 [Clostridia bacterium]|nr:hypothetical protein [Clostridia bacterium]
MKVTRVTTALLAVVLLICTLTACSPSMKEVAGTYTGSYRFNGDYISVCIILSEDGTYVKATSRGSGGTSTETGDFEIKGKQVILYDSDSPTYHGMSSTYNYQKGVLENNGHQFTKD